MLLPGDIFAAYRLRKGVKDSSHSIHVRFCNTKVRASVLRPRRELRSTMGPHIFISEHLTKDASKLFIDARFLICNKKIDSTWTRNGSVFIAGWEAIAHTLSWRFTNLTVLRLFSQTSAAYYVDQCLPTFQFHWYPTLQILYFGLIDWFICNFIQQQQIVSNTTMKVHEINVSELLMQLWKNTLM